MSVPLHAGAMQLSGKYENVRNLWTTSARDVSNGDTLGFTLVCIEPTAPATLCMQLSGNAVTHKQMTFDFSLFNGTLGRQEGTKIWMLAPAVQNQLKHAIGLADASVTSEAAAAVLGAHSGIVHAYALGSNLKGEFFMQFGLVNQMSKGVAGSMRAVDYAKDATACTVPTNSEVLLRFTIGDPSVERECTGDEVVEFVRERTSSNTETDDEDSFSKLKAKTEESYRKNEEKYGVSYTHTHRKKLEQYPIDLKALKRYIGDRVFWGKFIEKYDEISAIMHLFGAAQPKAKETAKDEMPLNAPALQAPQPPPQPPAAVLVTDAVAHNITSGVSTQKQTHRRAKTASHPTSDKPLLLGEESKAADEK